MKYVDAGYVVALGTLFVYALVLVARRRHLERAASAAMVPEGSLDPDEGLLSSPGPSGAAASGLGSANLSSLGSPGRSGSGPRSDGPRS